MKKEKIKKRKVFGTEQRPRLSVYRSLRNIYSQVINDDEKKVIVSASTLEAELKKKLKDKNKVAEASLIGQVIAERALAKGIKKVVFDRGFFLYHGRLKALADAARVAGLDF